MYEIIKNGSVISRTEKPNYIYRHDKGFYVLCDRDIATGVAVNGTTYALSEGSLGDCEVVTVVEKDAGLILHEQVTLTNEAEQRVTMLENAIKEGLSL